MYSAIIKRGLREGTSVTTLSPLGRHQYRVADAAHISKHRRIRQRCPRCRNAQRCEQIVYGVDYLRFPWFTSHSSENAFLKYAWVLLCAGSSSSTKFCSLVSARFSFGLDFPAPRSLGVVGVVGWWGSPGCGAPRGGSKPLKNCGLGQFAVGTPRE